MQRHQIGARIGAVLVAEIGARKRAIGTSRASSRSARLRSEAVSSEKETTFSNRASGPRTLILRRFERRGFSIPNAVFLCRLDKSLDARRGAQLDHAFVEILLDARLCEERCAAPVWPITFKCPKASRTQSIAAAFFTNGLTPSADARIATASKKTEGAPGSDMSAGRCFPQPPLLRLFLERRPRAQRPPSPPRSQASRRSLSAPFVTSTPIFRLSGMAAPLPRATAPGDGSRSIGGRRANCGRLARHADRRLHRLREPLIDHMQMAQACACELLASRPSKIRS